MFPTLRYMVAASAVLGLLTAVVAHGQENGGVEGCIKINEVLSKPRDEGEVDWVELLNACEGEVDLTGWTLTEENGELFVFGQGGCNHRIPAQSYMLLYKQESCSFVFGLGGSDEVTLINRQGQLVDSTVWQRGDAPKGRSWSRIPDGTGGWVNSRPTPGEFNGLTLNPPARVAQSPDKVTVVINELANKVPEGEEDWVELYNYGTERVDLTGLRLTDNRTRVDDGFYFGEPGCEGVNTIIPAGSYLLLERDLPCSFTFGLGDSDETHLFFDETTELDSTRFGPDFGRPIIPERVTWCRNPRSANTPRQQVFTTCEPTKGFSNGREIVGDELNRLVVEMLTREALSGGANGRRRMLSLPA